MATLLGPVPTARIATALVLLAVVMASIFTLPPDATTLVFSIFLFLGASEWARLSGIEGYAARLVYALAILCAALGACWAGRLQPVFTAVLVVGSTWWVLAAAWIITYQHVQRPVTRGVTVSALLGVLVFVPALVALNHLLLAGPTHLLGLFCIVWSADILAYVGGRQFGRNSLASAISPGKTWEGVASALCGTLVLGAGVNLIAPIAPFATIMAVIVLTLAASIFGDLLESLVKRLRGVKDSGTLLPGHGGVLDRIDSLLAAAPVYTLTLYIMGHA